MLPILRAELMSFILASANLSVKFIHSFIHSWQSLMKSTTKSGLRITFAPFWLVWHGPGDGGPEQFPHILTDRPQNNNAKPLSESEAIEIWQNRCFNDCTASENAREYLLYLIDHRANLANR
jgi:hypothetical protein